MYFSTPIPYRPLTSLDNLIEFSEIVPSDSEKTLVYYQNNGQIAFVTKGGTKYVTPYRPEVGELLEENNFQEEAIFVPFSNGEQRTERYKWLEQIADEECMAYTHKLAYAVSKEKGIDGISWLNSKRFHLKEISGWYRDKESNFDYEPMVLQFLHNDSEKSIGTYVLINSKTVLMCDQYGRTFLIKAKDTVDNVVRLLLDSGFTRNTHPEYYIKKIMTNTSY